MIFENSNDCKKIYRVLLAIAILAMAFQACSSETTPEDYDPPGATITTSKEVRFQVRRTWRFDGLSFTNEFAGARLNDVTQDNDSLYHLYIEPENGPINNSPWYSFALWSEEPRQIKTILHYPEDYGHRYYPKLSLDQTTWQPIDSNLHVADTIQGTATLQILASADTLYIGGQPRYASSHTYDWAENVSKSSSFELETIGYSVLGKPVIRLLGGNSQSKKSVVILGRQHPPEVTGYLAMQAFVKRLTSDDPLARQFRNRFSLLVYPMVNPDGVDQGHWRHNAAGIDLNRDWVDFNQPEPRAIKEDVEAFMNDQGSVPVFFIDFHSTQEDLFYVFAPDRPSALTGFTHQWLDEIENRLENYESVREETTGTSPVSTRYFYETFNTEAVTYEVGDNSTPERVAEISTTAAEVLMKLLTESRE